MDALNQATATSQDEYRIPVLSKEDVRSDDDLADELRWNVARLSLSSHQVAACWDVRQRRLAQAVLTQRPSDFLRWPAIHQAHILATRQREAHDLLRQLRSRPDWRRRFFVAAQDSGVGNPQLLRGAAKMSPNSINVAYHLARWEDAAQTTIDKLDVIFEFGGGYGSLCRAAHRLGFKGRYVMFDLPVISALQSYFLKRHQLPVRSASALSQHGSGIVCSADLNEVSQLLDAAQTNERSLFVATFSLCEAPLALREATIRLVRAFSHHLLTYQIAFAGIDNMKYFHEMTERASLARLSWSEARLAHQPLNYYLFGFPSAISTPQRSLIQATRTERLCKRLLEFTDWTLI